MKGGRSGVLKPDRLGLSCKVNKCSDAGTGNLGVLTTHETSPCFSLGDAGSLPTRVCGIRNGDEININQSLTRKPFKGKLLDEVLRL